MAHIKMVMINSFTVLIMTLHCFAKKTSETGKQLVSFGLPTYNTHTVAGETGMYLTRSSDLGDRVSLIAFC